MKRYAAPSSATNSLARTLLAIHQAFDELRQELALFSRFTQTNICDIVDLVHKETNGSPAINLCYMAARHVNSKLSEEPSPQMDKKKWLDWFARINHASALIQRFVNTCAPTTAAATKPATQATAAKDASDQYEKFDEFRSLWQRVSLTKCYIEHLWLKNDNLDIVYKRCILFWNAFKTGFDLTKPAKQSPFETLIKWLRPLDAAIRKLLLKPCAYCNITTYKRLYRLQPCACVVCDKCEPTLTDKCRKCNRDIGSSAPVEDELGLKRYYTFKSSLNDFITDVIANVCLDTRMSSNATPTNEAINSMIELLMPASKEQLVAEDQLFNFSLNPSVKSTLFQLLLNYDEVKMESYLTGILSRSTKFLEQWYESDDLANLQLMYLNAIEDSLYSKSSLEKSTSNFGGDMSTAVLYMNEINENSLTMKSDSVSDNIMAQFKLISKVKFCLVTCSKLLDAAHKPTESSNYFTHRKQKTLL